MQLQTRSPSRTTAPREVRPPSVLVVLVVKDGAEWLPRCLHGLSRQTYPRLGVIAIDNGSTDESVNLLEGTLGAARVIPLNRNLGFPGAVAAALRSDVAQQSDYVLLMHDDTVLAPNAVANLVAAAERIDGVGVVGPKVLDWEEPQVLREIGHSTDRFGYPYSPLDDGEIDQGQYERIRDVLFVSSCAMLVSRALWIRIGPPDERLAGSYDDLDYCWRARLAGFKVLMTPLAVAHHREATVRGKRPGVPGEIRIRYERERAALASMLKNYSFLSLLWVLPLYLVLGLLRVAVFIVSRKFEDAYQLLSAWRWNLVRLPGTILRRWRAQRVRAVHDRVVRQSMAPAGIRLRRWMIAAASALLPQSVGEPEGGRPVPVAVKVARYVGAHPVATAWGVGLVVALIAYRGLFTASPLIGGALGVPPSSPLEYFRELGSGLRHTGLGGNYAASPALAIFGAGSAVTLGSPALFQKILLLLLPAFAAVGCYRAVRMATGADVPSAVAAVCYGVSSLILWGVSQGELSALIFMAGVPWLVMKLSLPFRRDFRLPMIRWVAGAAVGLAVLTAFFPGTLLAAVVVVASLAVFPFKNPRRTGAVALALAAIAASAILIFPLAIDMVRAAGSPLGSEAGGGTFVALARLAVRPGPGLWRTGFYLPLAAAIGLPIIAANHRSDAVRAGCMAVVSVYLAWLSARGYLPTPLSNPIAYLGLLAFAYVFLVGLALASLASSTPALKRRGVAVGILGVLIGVGLLGQLAQAARGRWTVGGPERIPAAYPIVTDESAASYRVLWVGRIGRDSFPPPGGASEGSIRSSSAAIRYAVRGPQGASALDTGRGAIGPGYDYLRTVLGQIVTGSTRHGGALLAPLSIRYVIAEERGLPEVVVRRLTRQVDMDVMPAGGLLVMRNPKVVPIYSIVNDDRWRRAAFSDRLEDLAVLSAPQAIPLGPTALGMSESTSLVFVGQQFDRRWNMARSGGADPIPGSRAFHWAVAFEGRPASTSAIQFDGHGERHVEMVLLSAVWLVALWLIRKPPHA